jgi:hypothetical protein
VATDAHRVALSKCLDELDAAHGRATPDEAASAEAVIDELMTTDPEDINALAAGIPGTRIVARGPHVISPDL